MSEKEYRNPYLAPNPIAAGLDGLTKGLMGGYQFITNAENEKADREMKTKLFEANMAKNNFEMAQLKQAAQQQQNYRNDVKSMYAPAQGFNEAAFNTAMNPESLDYKTMPDGRRVAMMTDEGNQGMTGLMAGGISPQNLGQLMMKYGNVNTLPQQLDMQYKMQDRPTAMAQATANLDETQSQTANRKFLQDLSASEKVDLGDSYIYVDKRNGQPVNDFRTGQPMAPIKKGVSPDTKANIAAGKYANGGGGTEAESKAMALVDKELKNYTPGVYWDDLGKQLMYNGGEQVPRDVEQKMKMDILARRMAGNKGGAKAPAKGQQQGAAAPVAGKKYNMSDGSVKTYMGIVNGKPTYK